jgi:hypothetical protein
MNDADDNGMGEFVDDSQSTDVRTGSRIDGSRSRGEPAEDRGQVGRDRGSRCRMSRDSVPRGRWIILADRAACDGRATLSSRTSKNCSGGDS